MEIPQAGKDAGNQILKWVTDSAVTINAGVARRHLRRVLVQHPERSPAQTIRALDNLFRSTVTASGAGVGAAAAAPGVGTGFAAALSAVEAMGFVEASAYYTMAVAEIHGVDLQDVERRKAILLTVFAGDAGTSTLNKILGRTGPKWGKAITKAIPNETLVAINKAIGKNVVTKWGTKEGIIVFGRLIPFGIGLVIGGVAGGVSAAAIIKAVHHAFGAPPEKFPDGLLNGVVVTLGTSPGEPVQDDLGQDNEASEEAGEGQNVEDISTPRIENHEHPNDEGD